LIDRNILGVLTLNPDAAKNITGPVEGMGLKKGGTVFPLESSLAMFSALGGNYCTVIVRDITKRREVRDQLLKSNMFLDALMENIPAAVFVKEIKELRYLFWNKAAEIDIGVAKQDIIGKTDYDVFSREIADHLTAADRLTAETGELLNIPEERVDVPRKGTSFFRTKKVPLFNQQGLPEFILGIAENITEQRQMESALRESEIKYRNLLRDLTDAVLLADDNGNIFEVNKKAELLLGYTSQELTGMNFADLHPEQERDSVVNLVKTTLLQKGAWALHDVQLKKKDGTTFPADISGHFIEYAGEKVIQGIIHDISERKAIEAELEAYRRHLEDLVKTRTAELTTLNLQLQQEIAERKQTEDALRRSEEQLRSVIETASDAVITANSSGNIILWNKGAEAMFGYPAEEILNRPFTSLLSEHFVEAHRQKFNAFMAEAKPGVLVGRGELRGRRKDGSEFPTEGSASLWQTSDGVFTTSLVRDISERKRSEELLRESEDRFRNLAQSATEAIIIIDSEGAIIFWNKSAERMYGYTQEEVLHKNNSMLVPARLQSQSERYFEQLRRDPAIAAPDHFYQSCARRKDGSEFPVEVALSLWSTGDLTFYCVMLRDITERTRVVKMIQESEDKFRTMAENITAAILIYQNANLIYANTAAAKLSGYLREELPGMRFWDIIHPDFKEQAHEWDRMQHAGEELPSRFELKIKTKNGEERWVDYTAAIIVYNGAEAVLGTAVDIPERKKAEELINKVNETLLSLGPDSDQNIQIIVEKAAMILEGANASYHRKQGKSLTIAAMWNLPQHYRTMNPAIADSFDRMISLYSGSPVILSDTDKITFSSHSKHLHKSAFKQFVAMPISMGTEIIGSLNVGYSARRAFSDAELNVFSIFAQAIGNEEICRRALVEIEQHRIKLQNSEKDLKVFSARILSIREEEKKNISRALHDELGSMVVALSSGLMIAREEIIENNLELALKNIERTEAALKDAVANLKKIIIDLRPPDLEIVGLSNALRSLCTTTAQQTKTAIDCSVDIEDKTIDDDTAITLYRTAQESLNNVHKHARAKNVTIRLSREKNKLKLSITDDGRGFNTASLDGGGRGSTGIGIQGMRERVAALGGTFFLQSAPQKGTALHITIPAKKRRRP